MFVHDGFSDERGYSTIYILTEQMILETLAEHVTKLTLTHRPADVHWHSPHCIRRQLLLNQQIANLRSVAMYENDLESRNNEVHYSPR